MNAGIPVMSGSSTSTNLRTLAHSDTAVSPHISGLPDAASCVAGSLVLPIS